MARERGRPRYPDILTPVEWAIVLLVHEGLSNGEIAQVRNCRVDTVKYHVANILAKLELDDRDALKRWRGPDDETESLRMARGREGSRSMSSSTVGRAVITGVAPMFLVDDVARTAEWYRDRLGFEIGEFFRQHHYHGEHPPDGMGEPVFVILGRNGQRLMLGKTMSAGEGVRSNTDAKQWSCDAYFWVEGIAALHAQCRSAGAKPGALEETPYGLAEFKVRDCDGHALTFGGPTSG